MCVCVARGGGGGGGGGLDAFLATSGCDVRLHTVLLSIPKQQWINAKASFSEHWSLSRITHRHTYNTHMYAWNDKKSGTSMHVHHYLPANKTLQVWPPTDVNTIRRRLAGLVPKVMDYTCTDSFTCRRVLS